MNARRRSWGNRYCSFGEHTRVCNASRHGGAGGLVGYVNVYEHVAGEAGGKRTVRQSILQNLYKPFLFMYVCVCVFTC